MGKNEENTKVNDSSVKNVSYVKAVRGVDCADQACMAGYMVSLTPVPSEATLPFILTVNSFTLGVGVKCVAEQSRQWQQN